MFTSDHLVCKFWKGLLPHQVSHFEQILERKMLFFKNRRHFRNP